MQLKNKLILFILMLAIIACKNEKAFQLPNPNEVVIPDSFLEFYEKFNSDSIFQKERIIFPLSQKTDSTKWTAENWIVHQPFNNEDGEYAIEFNNFQNIIIEIIQDEQQIFRSERRFSESGGEWNLIFYKLKTLDF